VPTGNAGGGLGYDEVTEDDDLNLPLAILDYSQDPHATRNAKAEWSNADAMGGGYAEGGTDASAQGGGSRTGRSDDQTAAEKALAEENARRMGLPGQAHARPAGGRRQRPARPAAAHRGAGVSGRRRGALAGMPFASCGMPRQGSRAPG
jgi:hypothetical protein